MATAVAAPVASRGSRTRGGPSHRRSLTIAHGTLDTITAERCAALADAVRAGGDECAVVAVGDVDASTRGPVVITSPGGAEEDTDGKQDCAGRLFSHPFAGEGRNGPFSGLGVGVALTYGGTNGSVTDPLLPGYRSPGQNTVFSYRLGPEGTFADGDRLRVTPQFYW